MLGDPWLEKVSGFLGLIKVKESFEGATEPLLLLLVKEVPKNTMIIKPLLPSKSNLFGNRRMRTFKVIIVIIIVVLLFKLNDLIRNH